MAVDVRCVPATAERWPDLERLFGKRGACGGCWCMYWRRTRAEFNAGKGATNRRALMQLVESETPPGVVAYSGEEPVGWCAVAPRDTYPTLARSRILKPVDDAPVWSVSCLFVARPFRRKGVSEILIRAAAELARQHGAALVEAYPVEPKAPMADAFVWTGLAPAFVRAGFTEVARRSPTRPILRLAVRP
ncbi:MAG: GNAT family N-acetyltransferase [Bryobacteraceae bacterium]